jgi:hypothetical protein
MAPAFDPARAGRYGELGIDYLVLKAGTEIPGQAPTYRNARYWVYAQ